MKKSRWADWFLTAGFLGFLALALAVTLIRPKSGWSYYENRNLAHPAELSVETLLDGTFPASSITREQLATMLWRAAGSPEAKGALTNFNDAASVSSWATQAMTWAVEQGLISGMGDGALNPQGNATRAQLAVILTAYAK